MTYIINGSRRAMRYNMLVNSTGMPGGFQGVDCLIEPLLYGNTIGALVVTDGLNEAHTFVLKGEDFGI